MQKARSPQYPSIGLKEAVEKVRAVYDNDYQNAVPRAVVAEHMGYQGLNGKSLGVLSALSKFGLLEGRGDETRVSDLAVHIIAHPPGSIERAHALVEAAGKPELFKELDTRFPGKVSDQALRSYLLTQKFIPSAADAAIRSYRETKALVDNESGSYDSGVGTLQKMGAPDGHAMLSSDPPTSAVPALPPPTPNAVPFRLTVTPGGVIEGNFRLNNSADLEAFVSLLQGMKFVFKMVDDIKNGRELDPARYAE